MVLSHPNKEFGFRPSNPNPWAQIHSIQIDYWRIFNKNNAGGTIIFTS
jgi:hypothetical protein